MNEPTDRTLYARAYQAALPSLKREHRKDPRRARDAAHSVASIAAMVAQGKLALSDVKNPDEPGMKAALRAVGQGGS